MKNSFSFHALLIAALICSLRSTAQPGWKWARGATDDHNVLTEGMSVAVDKSGNVFCGGWVDMYDTVSTDSCRFGPYVLNAQNEGFVQLFVAKTDSEGNFQWVLGAHGSNHSYATAMVTDTAGNVYVLVTYYDTCILGTDTLTAPTFEYALMKVSGSTGSVLWVKKLGDQGATAEPNYETMGMDGAGNIYVSGAFTGTTFGSATVTGAHSTIIAKLNAAGDVVWANALDGSYGGMAVAKDGSVYEIGEFSGTLTSGSHALTATSGHQPYLIKLDSSGHTVWMSTSTAASLAYDAIATDDDSRLYLACSFQGTITYGTATFTPPAPSGYHVLTACLDTSSAIMWARAAYDTGTAPKAPYSIGVDRCGKVVVTIGFATLATPPTDYMVFGTDTLHVPDSSYDPIFVAEYDSSGNYVHSSALPGGGEDYIGAHLDYTGNLYICADIAMPTMVVAGDTVVNRTDESFYLAKYHYDDVVCRKEQP